METVQLKCGNCNQLMAIGVEHMGGQVQCPHCKSVVQTPPRNPPAAPPPPPAAPPPMELDQRESIFTGPESSDAIMGETPAPQVEMPSAETSTPSAEQPAEADTDFAKFKSRPVYTASVIPVIGLIFLVPYAIVMTLFVLYLLFGQNKTTHPLDMLPDPVPDKGKGGPRQTMKIPHTREMDAAQIVGIGKTRTIGDIAATPTHVFFTTDGNLQLHLRAQNVSTNTAFEPTNETFVRYFANKVGTEPYSYIESKTHAFGNLYGASLGYHRKGTDEEVGFAVLNPGQETTIVLTTYPDHQKTIAKLVGSSEALIWRVQLRRGLVKWRGKDVSTTAVIGVAFTGSEIERKRT